MAIYSLASKSDIDRAFVRLERRLTMRIFCILVGNTAIMHAASSALLRVVH